MCNIGMIPRGLPSGKPRGLWLQIETTKNMDQFTVALGWSQIMIHVLHCTLRLVTSWGSGSSWFVGCGPWVHWTHERPVTLSWYSLKVLHNVRGPWCSLPPIGTVQWLLATAASAPLSGPGQQVLPAFPIWFSLDLQEPNSAICIHTIFCLQACRLALANLHTVDSEALPHPCCWTFTDRLQKRTLEPNWSSDPAMNLLVYHAAELHLISLVQLSFDGFWGLTVLNWGASRCVATDFWRERSNAGADVQKGGCQNRCDFRLSTELWRKCLLVVKSSMFYT